MVSRTLLLTVLFAIAIGFGAAAYSLAVGGGSGRSAYISTGEGRSIWGDRDNERGGERGGGFFGNFGERGHGEYDND